MNSNLINLTQTKEEVARIYAEAYLDAAQNGSSYIYLDTKANSIETGSWEPKGDRYVILEEIQGNVINADENTEINDLAQAFIAGDFQMDAIYQLEDEQQEYVLFYSDEVAQ